MKKLMVLPVLVAPVLIGSVFVASCAAVPAAYMAADRATYDAVAPAQRAYVLGDPKLSELERDAALTTLDLWLARLNANKE